MSELFVSFKGPLKLSVTSEQVMSLFIFTSSALPCIYRNIISVYEVHSYFVRQSNLDRQGASFYLCHQSSKSNQSQQSQKLLHQCNSPSSFILFLQRTNLLFVTSPSQLKLPNSPQSNHSKKKVAKKLNYSSELIFLSFKGVTLAQEEKTEAYNLQTDSQLLVLLWEREQKLSREVRPLLVGGIDLTDIAKPKQNQNQKSFLSKEGEGMKGESGGGKYAQELRGLKGMGFEEERALLALEQRGGNMEEAVNLLLS